MKKIIYIAISALLLGSCNEKSFLEETPRDFMSSKNSYSTSADFDLAVNELYYLTRYEFYCNGERSVMDYLFGTDFVWNGSSGSSVPNLAANYGPSAAIPQAHWDKLYLLIAQSNTIISRLPKSSVPESEQVLFNAKAKFFRGLAYRTLAYLYGGVPLQLEEVLGPKTNYVRATREQTIAQAVEDVKFAAENLKDITAVKDGEVSAPAAYHLLSELYLAQDKAQEAVDAATKVISNPALGLMTQRFGSRATEQPGDVYWDLYRTGNQNRSTYGNREGIFVIQMQVDVLGGGTDITSIWSSPGSYLLERHCAPQTSLFKMYKNGVSLTQSPFNWPTGDYTGGRGIGSIIPTTHFDKEVWASDFKTDIRNANHNFVRKFAYNNPAFKTLYKELGDTLDIDNPPAGYTFLTGENSQTTFPGRYLTCYQTKVTNPYDHPKALYSNAATYALSGSSGGTYTDQYMFRLAETYLLRAEAYLKQSKTDLAAADINVVRARANASKVSASAVTLDYILDERIRELGVEEKRRLTLGRLGADVFYNRVIKYNPYYSLGTPFTKNFTLYAIPQSAIDANKDAVLDQNPGYL
ncbi:RagB/SusD family nutrient uptake outer membrane protein [Filimonas effusa]|uniref:RagB/SusD family nutrient uptake outer membrane protein n=1 Tax=Filimonas effusa TaxID=2508721 RepID=A0A4Q1D8E9_9BACT|nr:RagB/SusD family nutrient uptake outer membrane protein [Filimonas effusa]RXK85480.1 RagB/SusD family nutrient uptake outer membrane protein [Filimonas effusa]